MTLGFFHTGKFTDELLDSQRPAERVPLGGCKRRGRVAHPRHHPQARQAGHSSFPRFLDECDSVLATVTDGGGALHSQAPAGSTLQERATEPGQVRVLHRARPPRGKASAASEAHPLRGAGA